MTPFSFNAKTNGLSRFVYFCSTTSSWIVWRILVLSNFIAVAVVNYSKPYTGRMQLLHDFTRCLPVVLRPGRLFHCFSNYLRSSKNSGRCSFVSSTIITSSYETLLRRIQTFYCTILCFSICCTWSGVGFHCKTLMHQWGNQTSDTNNTLHLLCEW